ncbi:DUF2058 domain-containing protein [Oceanicoccus sp. KOV_DT_Chl]|uniref:DUF2058 domain-containing protein n=1 Tax=Oceanicoccus sp. KOV_DT_Chl TaxID=1904639 RepID=UPI000C7973A4|nr:DUF2058 domain-containing protein [Oceanicoccus sp. KOV_DT_Chl]
MAGSLQDQLLKAGLADSKKAKKINKDKSKQAKQQRKNQVDTIDETKIQVQQAREQKVQRDRELNEQRKAEADKKAIAAQVKQLITVNRIERSGGEVDYNFTDQKKIKKILVNPVMLEQLSRGWLAIVSLEGKYELVPAAVAEKISQRLPDRVIVCNEAVTEQLDEDDPYAQYQIPDDLMW